MWPVSCWTLGVAAIQCSPIFRGSPPGINSFASGGSLRNDLPGPLRFSSAEFIFSADQPELGLGEHPRDERVALLDPFFQVLS